MAKSNPAATRNPLEPCVVDVDGRLYIVGQSGASGPTAPVLFSAHLGRGSFRDFLSADQAEQLATALTEHAAHARARDGGAA